MHEELYTQSYPPIHRSLCYIHDFSKEESTPESSNPTGDQVLPIFSGSAISSDSAVENSNI